MPQAALIVGVVIFIVGVWVLVSKLSEKRESQVDSPFFRRDTFIVSWDYGIVAAKKLQRTDKGYTYILGAENEGQVEKAYGDTDLIPLNPHLNVIGYQVYIESAVVANLTDKIDMKSLTKNFEEEKERVALLQAENNELRSNLDLKMEQMVAWQERMGKANRPNKTRMM